MLENFGKLQMLKIKSYTSVERNDVPTTITVMFNPDTITIHHENQYQKKQGINTIGRQARYLYSLPQIARFKLIIDGTGAGELALITKSVGEQVSEFLDNCYHMDGDLHEPRFLKLQWGEGELQDFDCRLRTVDIKYTLFNDNGSPLRAELDISFVQDMETQKRVALEGKSSPDLSHSRVVKAGDTLPLMCKAIYGSSKYYMRVAQYNRLDNFRQLTTGQTLIFPPLDVTSETT